MIQHGVILPTAGFEQINPKIESKEKIKIVDAPMTWPVSEPKRVLVTNFGKLTLFSSSLRSWLRKDAQGSAAATALSCWRLPVWVRTVAALQTALTV